MTGAGHQHARVNTENILIISIRLATLSDAGSPPRVMYAALEPYFQGASRKKLRYLDMPFDIRTTSAAKKYRDACDRELAKLGRCVCLLCLYSRSDFSP